MRTQKKNKLIRLPTRQRGFAFLLLAAVLIVVAGYMGVRMTESLSVSYTTEREARTAAALKQAKDAVLAWVAMNAARTSELYPGRLPCPEVKSLASNQTYAGFAGPFDSTTSPASASAVACDGVGRLPWKTLGMDQPKDGYGQPLWYAVSTGTWAWTNNNDVLTINPGSANQLSFDGSTSAVAVIIAPGPALNTAIESGTPPSGCSAVTQNQTGTTPAIANYLECGNATGAYKTIVGTLSSNGNPWSNDRAIAITAKEVMDAISAAVAERMQKQVAVTLNNWRATALSNWGISFLPYPSAFTNPSTNDLCGDVGTREGLLPLVGASTTSCSGWTSTGASITATSSNTTVNGTPTWTVTSTSIQASFVLRRGSGGAATGTVTGRVSIPAPRVAASFRNAITVASVTVSSPSGASTSNFGLTLSPTTGAATLTVDLSKTGVARNTNTTFIVQVPHLPNASILTDSNLTWFTNAGWHLYTYYAIGVGGSVNPTSACAAAGDAGCLTVSGVDSSNGNTNDKKFVLILSGRPLSGHSMPSGTLSDYFEDDNASTGDNTFKFGKPTSTFNDRAAMCPFQRTFTTGASAICS